MAGTPFSFLPQDVFTKPLTEEEQALRDVFVSEYLKDFNPVLACIRVGFTLAYATEFAKVLMVEPYVQSKLQELTRTSVVTDPEEEAKQDLSMIKNGLREAGQHGPYASRVQAWRTLAQIHGFDRHEAPAEDEDNLAEQFRQLAQEVPA